MTTTAPGGATEQERAAVAEARVTDLNHVAIGVRSLEESLRFYVDGLGMRKTLQKRTSDLTAGLMRLPDGASGTTVFVQAESRVGQLELVKWDMPESDDGRAKRPGDIGLGVLSFKVAPEHIEALHQRLVDTGFEVYSEPTTAIVKNYGPVTPFLCEDPDGTQVDVCSLPAPETVREFRARSAS